MSISINPLRLGTLLAVIVASIAFVYSVYVIFVAVFLNTAVPGWASAILIISFIGAMQLLVLGVIGEYIGQILIETRRRPAYLVEETNIGHNTDFTGRKDDKAP